MSQLPSFQFYPGDWRRDPAVLSLTRHDRSVWFDLICIMHDSPERGVLLLPNGRPMSDVEIGRNLGLTPAQTLKAIDAIIASGTGSRRDDGAIYNRRMVKDEGIRLIRKTCGKLGGNPDLVNQNITKFVDKVIQGNNQTPTPSSSSSSSKKEPPTPKAPARLKMPAGSLLRFGEFWEKFPKKRGKGAAEKSWARQNLDSIADEILFAVGVQKGMAQWRKDNGDFIPYPATWLNEKRWQDSCEAPIPTERRLVL